MSGSWGKKVNISIFGESHGTAIGCVINGIPPGTKIDMNKIKKDMIRRAPGRDKLSTPRKESDEPIILSGVLEGVATGTPIAMMINNGDTKSKDYSKIKDIIRPSHGDYSGFVKYKGFNDYRGGGHFSGRITAPLVFAGSLAKSVLEEKGIFIGGHIKKIGSVSDDIFNKMEITRDELRNIQDKELPVINDNVIDTMKEEVMKCKRKEDSIGGTIECCAIGLEAGVGSPFFDSLESTIAHLAFSVPAVKGIEFGIGFDFGESQGSVVNDEYCIKEGKVKTLSNNNGGITGGISNGMPVVFSVVIKPTPSISKVQKSVNIRTMKEEEITIVGRHDPCIVQRAVVVMESIMALAILELL